jgi:hypothetical protein
MTARMLCIMLRLQIKIVQSWFHDDTDAEDMRRLADVANCLEHAARQLDAHDRKYSPPAPPVLSRKDLS